MKKTAGGVVASENKGDTSGEMRTAVTCTGARAGENSLNGEFLLYGLNLENFAKLNLNRFFLFLKEEIGQSEVTACIFQV